MIFLCCGKVPTSFDYIKTAIFLKSEFDNANSHKYIDLLLSKKNENAIKSSIFCLYLLQNTLHKAGFDCKELYLEKTCAGKPYFLNSNLYFSLSHSENFCCCAVGDNSRNIGADIECKIIDPEKSLRLAKRFFTSTEYEFVKKKPAQNFLIVWTAKEAYSKKVSKNLGEVLGSHDIFMQTHLSYTHFFEYEGALGALCCGKDEEICFCGIDCDMVI